MNMNVSLWTDVRERLQVYGARSVLAAAGVAIGVALMTVLGNTVASAHAYATAGLRNAGAGVVVVTPVANLSQGGRTRPISILDVTRVRRQATSFEAVSPIFSLRGSVQACGRTMVTSIVGVSSDLEAIGQWQVSGGRLLSDVDSLRMNSVAVVGSQLAKELPCLSTSASTIRVSGIPYGVVGILEAHGTAIGADRDNVVGIPLDVAMRRYRSTIGPLIILLRRHPQVPEAQAIAELTRILRESHQLTAGVSDDFAIQSQAQLLKTTADVAQLAAGILLALVGVSLVVAAVGVLNSVLTSVWERRSEIGLRRAVGADRLGIFRQFLIESALIVGAGVVAGIVAGLAISYAIGAIVGVTVETDVSTLALAATASMVLGLAAGIVPALRASRLSPIEALHHE